MAHTTYPFKTTDANEVILYNGASEISLDSMLAKGYKVVGVSSNTMNCAHPYLGELILTRDDTWAMTAEATAAVATVTKAGEAGKTHRLTAVNGGYLSSTSGNITIKDGATVLAKIPVYDEIYVAFPDPIEATEGNALTVELSSGGTGLTGTINMFGNTG